MYFLTKDKSQCCGCTACHHVCPKSCITMQYDDEGFAYPVIDKDVCIDCHACERVCPMANPEHQGSASPETYATILRDINQRRTSSSGGAFCAVADLVFKKGGIVVGSTMDKDLQVHHISISSAADLHLLKGSKYVQSRLDHVFKIIKQELQAGRWCYFVGTGCQVAGLKAFLHRDYPNLITSDLVCHGVPSQKLLNEHIAYLQERYHHKVTTYEFRDNSSWSVCEKVGFEGRKPLINGDYKLSPYLYSFIHAMTYRPSCYVCPFAAIPRQGDITLADCWGARHFIDNMQTKFGVSLVLTNTDKGRQIWQEARQSCEWKMVNITDCIAFNGNLVHATHKPHQRDHVYQDIEKRGYKAVAKSTFRPSIYYVKRITNAMKNFPVTKPIAWLWIKMKGY